MLNVELKDTWNSLETYRRYIHVMFSWIGATVVLTLIVTYIEDYFEGGFLVKFPFSLGLGLVLSSPIFLIFISAYAVLTADTWRPNGFSFPRFLLLVFLFIVVEIWALIKLPF